MFKTIRAIVLGRQGRAEAALETANAAVIIEQKLREADAAHSAAKRALAALIVKIETEERALDALQLRLEDLTERTRAAMEAGSDDLARDAAAMVAQLENERSVREDTLGTSRLKAERMRLAIERTHRQLVDLRQGLITAQSVERERRAMGHAQGSVSARSAIREGEAVLKRLLASEDPVGVDDALERIEDDLSGDSVVARMADAGFGAPLRTRAEDVLERLRAQNKAKPAKA